MLSSPQRCPMGRTCSQDQAGPGKGANETVQNGVMVVSSAEQRVWAPAREDIITNLQNGDLTWKVEFWVLL